MYFTETLFKKGWSIYISVQEVQCILREHQLKNLQEFVDFTPGNK